jgi:hypothetical protein
MKLTAKDRLRMYAYGGTGDEDKKAARKSTTIPDGYEIDKDYIDKDNPNRVYYKKMTITSSTKTGSNNASPSVKKAVKPLGNYTAVKPRVGTSRKNISDTLIDRIYLEPDQQKTIPEDTEQEAFKGENIFTKRGSSNMAIGQARYPSRKSVSKTDGGVLNTQDQNVEFMYYQPNSSKIDYSKGKHVIPFSEWNNRGQASNFADTGFINRYAPKMGLGGEVDQLPELLKGLTDLLSNTRSNSTQPIMSATAIHNMENPYSHMAMGGSVDDLTQEEYSQLQEQADSFGISVEDLLQRMNADLSANSPDDYSGDNESDETSADNEGDEGEYAYGGIHIKRQNKGKFTAAAKAAGKGVQSYAREVLDNPRASKTLRMRANFARSAAKWKHGYGGKAIEVEGNEIVHEPGKAPVKMSGPSHEEGGIDINVDKGTRIYSDRLGIDGKTMQQRKAGRERRISKIEKLLDKYPSNSLTRNTVSRSLEHIDAEEERDMKLQEVANHLYSPEGQAGYGGVDGDIRDDNDLLQNILGRTHPSYSVMNNSNIDTPKPNTVGLTTGDYIGLAGTAFGSLAPLLNTRNAAKATPNAVNRYQNFGSDALEANQKAQSIAGSTAGDSLIDIDSATGAAVKNNNNSASSVNTGRALNIATFLGADKARAGVRGNYSSQMMQLLGQEGNLENQKDYYSDMGATMVDNERERNTDNYFTNHGADIAGLASGAQQIGRNLNIDKSNQVDANLISQLSMYGLEFDENGNLISTK